MNSCIKRIIAGLTAAVIITSPTAVYAAYTYEDAVEEFYDTLELIDSVYYFKDDVDYKVLLDAALVSVFDQLDDYSEYLTPEEYNDFSSYHEADKSGIGVTLIKTGAGYAEITKVFGDSPAEESGLLKGDIIMKAAGVDVFGKSINEIRQLILGAAGTDVKLTVVRNGELKEISATRGTFYAPHVDSIDISKLISGADNSKTAYVEISTFSHSENNPRNDTGEQFKQIYQELKNKKYKNLIIDLRGNTGGDVMALIDIAEILVKSGVMFTFKYVGQPDDVFTTKSTAPDFNVAVLVDDLTASSAEILASAIKESGSGVIVGSETFGKGVGQVPIPAADGEHVIKLTITEIISRNGNKINGIGVTPDISVPLPPWIEGVKTISSSSSSKEIISLKSALNYLGHEAGDGAAYDAKLTEAIKSFQTSASLEPDGICTPEVMYRINGYVSDKARKNDDALKKAYEILNK